MNGVTPDQARDFYRAAANFYRQAPWRSVGRGGTVADEVAVRPLNSKSGRAIP